MRLSLCYVISDLLRLSPLCSHSKENLLASCDFLFNNFYDDVVSFVAELLKKLI